VKLTAYFGERARADGGFLADALVDVFARHRLATSIVLRGAEGFGAKHGLRTDRLLTLSEDLPMVAVAVDSAERIEAAADEVRALEFSGLVTLERTSTGPRPEPAKLTVYLGRREQYRAVVDLLHRHGLSGATALLGVDGTAGGERERARFFSRNARVPVMVVAVGDVGPVLPELGGLVFTVERIREDLGEPPPGAWRKLNVHGDERTGPELLRALRRAGAAGATVLRGVHGYHGPHAPYGDTLFQLRRRVPTLTVVLDTPDRTRAWLPIAHAHGGLVTSELVPAVSGTDLAD
jgi:PII-like signaling protein